MKSVKLTVHMKLTLHAILLAGTVLLTASAEARNEDEISRIERLERLSAARLAREATRIAKAAEVQVIRETTNLRQLTDFTPNRIFHSSAGLPVNQIRQRNFNGQSHFLTSNDKAREVARGLELDLSSSERSIILGENLFANSSTYEIKIGNAEKTLSSGSQVSPAEFVALQQVITGGRQALVVDSNGKAIDGQLELSSVTDGGIKIHAKSLVIPSSVEAIGDLSRTGEFRLTGDLTNNGSIVVTEKPGGNTLAARDVKNGSAGSIVSMGNLTIAASNDLTNDGSISSFGTLTLSAGGQLSNSGKISAQSDISLNSAEIRNAGAVQSGRTVNISSPSPGAIRIDSTGGELTARDEINVRSVDFQSKVDTTITGGAWKSDSLKVFGGDGHTSINVSDITGDVTIHAGTAVVNSNGASLRIEDLVTTGDPLISNTGDVTLFAQTTNGGPLTVVAGRDLIIEGASVRTGSTTANSGNITLIAGADFTTTATTLQINGASISGGNIRLHEDTTSSVISTTGSGDSGSVLLAAFAGSSRVGEVRLFGVSIDTRAPSTKISGDVKVIAPGLIYISSINAAGTGFGDPGNVLLAGAQPEVSGTFLIDSATGTVLSGALTESANVGSGAMSTGSIQGGDIKIGGGNLTINGLTALSSASLSSAMQIALIGPTITPSLTLNLLAPTARAHVQYTEDNDISNLAGTGEGIIYANSYGSTTVTSLGASQSLVLNTGTTGSVTIGSDITTAGDINLTTNSLTNEHVLTANKIEVFSPNALSVSGGTGGSFSVTGDGERVLLGTWLGGITVYGNITFNSEGEITISNSPAPFTVDIDATIVGLQRLTINAQNVEWNGSLSANPLVFNYNPSGGTIANSLGDVNLTGPIITNGGDLAILAAGNITATGPLTINTSSTSGDGGTVLLWAGATIVPATPGQIKDSFTTFTVYSGSTGNILLPGVDINTSSSNGAGGSVTLAATNGTINTGNIMTSGAAIAGDVLIAAKLGSSVGNVSAEGTTGGDLNITGGGVGTTFGANVLNGTLLSELSISGNNEGPGSTGSLNLGNGSVTVTGPRITIGGPVSAHLVSLRATDVLDLTGVVGGITAQTDSFGQGGQIDLNARNDILFNSDAANPFILSANGVGNGSGGTIVFGQGRDVTPMYVGTVPKAKQGSQFLKFSANSGTGFGANAGSIAFGSLGPVYVNPDGISILAQGTGPSNGGTLLIEVGDEETKSTLSVNGDLNVSGSNGGGGGIISLGINSKTAFTLNSGKTPKNGISGFLTTGPGGAVTVESIFSNIVVKSSEAIQSSAISLFTGDGFSSKTTVTVAKGAVLTADNFVSIFNDGKTAKKNKLITVNTTKLNAGGTGKGIFENIGSDTLEVVAGYDGGFSLLSHSPIAFNQSLVIHGDIDVVSTNGSITFKGDPLFSGATVINAVNGNIKIQSTDITNGSIVFGLNSRLATSDHGGDITVVVGDIPKKPSHTVIPVNVTVIARGKGQAYFEPGPVAVNALAPSLVTAQNKKVVLSSSSPGRIVFEGNAQITAEDNYYSESRTQRSGASSVAELHTTPHTSSANSKMQFLWSGLAKN